MNKILKDSPKLVKKPPSIKHKKDRSAKNHLEIERKFLIECPNTWEQITNMMKHVVFVEQLQHTYCDSFSSLYKDAIFRLTQIYENYDFENPIYLTNSKQFVSYGIYEEIEKQITADEYFELQGNQIKNTNLISKTRFVICEGDHDFELDLFEDELFGLSLLEVEVKDLKEDIKFPNWMKITKEVTEDLSYSNYNLALKK